jgi:hypothetical protein
MDEVLLIIDHNGDLEFIHNDALTPLMAEGMAEVSRASHVEPCVDPRGTGGVLWQADLSPCNGPCLPATVTRGESLRAEVDWLHANYFRIGE